MKTRAPPPQGRPKDGAASAADDAMAEIRSADGAPGTADGTFGSGRGAAAQHGARKSRRLPLNDQPLGAVSMVIWSYQNGFT